MNIFHLHIPKTGGTTLNAILSWNIDFDRIFPHKQWFEWYEAGEPPLRGYQYYTGHFDWRFREIIGGQPDTVTLFRDPVERLLSTYFFWKQGNDVRFKLSLEAQNMTLDKWLASDTAWWEKRNFQCRMLAGIYDDTWPDEAIFRLARNNLLYLKAYGFTEDFEVSARRICHALNITMADYEPLMVTPASEGRDTVSKATRNKIAKMNEYDRMLYDLAREQWEK